MTDIDDKLFPATAMPDADWWTALWPDPDAVLEKLGVVPGMRVLDLCCGDGHFTEALARRVGPDGQVFALDLHPTLLSKAQQRLEKAGLSHRVTWIHADACAMAQELPHDVDFVLIANTFHGVPDKAALAREARQALCPGGLFAIVNWHRLNREDTEVLGVPRGPKTELRMSPQSVRVLVEPEGFRLRGVVELKPYHYGAVFH